MNHPVKNLTSKTTQGVAWLYGRRFVINFIHLGVVAVLARRLDPADFGVVALAAVILKFNVAVGASTVGNYIIYDREEGREERVQAAFWLNATMTLVAIAIFILLLPLVSLIYAEPLLPAIIAISLIKVAADQLRAVPDALIKRDLDYKKLVVRDGVLELISAGLSLAMALSGWGVWSIVVPQVLLAPVSTGLVMWMAGWMPRLPLGTKHWKRIFKYSSANLGNSIVNVFNNDGDVLLIGKLLGSTALGFYNRAWSTAHLITDNVVRTVSVVAMSSLSAAAGRPEVLRQAYLKMLHLLSIITFPLAIGLFVVADDFILVLYGAKWEPAILPLRILMIDSIRRSILSPATIVYNVVGRPDIGFKLNLAALPFVLASIALGSLYGIVGVAVAFTAIRMLVSFISVHLAARLIGTTLRAVLSKLWSPLEASVLMGIVVYAAKLLVGASGTLPAISLAVCVATGGSVYLLLLLTRHKQLLDEMLLVVDNLSLPLSRAVRAMFRRRQVVKAS